MHTNDSKAFRAFVLEAEIFARLSTRPKNVRLFADYLTSIEQAYADVTQEEAAAAGKAAGTAKTELSLAYANFFVGLHKRPHTPAIEKAQAVRRDKLREIEGVRDLLWRFERLAIGFDQNQRLSMAFCATDAPRAKGDWSAEGTQRESLIWGTAPMHN